ncbi:amidohydrolase [Microbacterium oleivorans]|uniref:amidohydrolase n=1 Tax=Microbacterium oleivorans TaxID=273677 RepID=UPI00203CDAC2|nr:amidohydrolase family protein [Microbacterium oleivorans]MCM3695098.1 amidohydrolase family protein [Microbacterium oleivorans]
MSADRIADTVIRGGRVITMTDGAGAPDALAITAGRIAAVGTRDEVDAWIGPDTRVIDLGDGTILPGFVDCHIHPVFGMGLTRGADLTRCRSLEDVTAVLTAELERLGDADWLLGWGLEPNVFPDEVNNAFLDDLVGDRPAFLRFFDAHAALASSSALALAGVRGDETFPDSSRVAKDAAGRPTGALLEVQAVGLVERVLPELSFDERVEGLYGILRYMAEAGFTAGQVQDLAPDAIALLTAIEATRDLPIRLRMSPWFEPGTDLADVQRLVELQGISGRDWTVRGVKTMIDGTIDNGTAWLEHPDLFGESTASLWLRPEEYPIALAALDAHGIPTTTHAIGDAGIAFVARAIAALPERTATHRVEHIEVLPDDILDVFATHGIAASMQPTHCTLFVRPDGSDNWSRRLGVERAALGWRTGDLVRAGVPLALGSDWPVAPADAPGILADAQLRRPHDDPDAPTVGGEQGISALDAVRGFTTQAYATIGETGGTLEVGALADITALDLDPLTTPAERIGDAKVLLTVVGGRVVVGE